MFHHFSTTCTLYTFKKRITKACFFLEFEFDLLLRIGLLQYRLFLWGTDPQRRIRKLLAVLLNLTRRKHVNNDQKTKWILDGGGFSIPNLFDHLLIQKPSLATPNSSQKQHHLTPPSNPPRSRKRRRAEMPKKRYRHGGRRSGMTGW